MLHSMPRHKHKGEHVFHAFWFNSINTKTLHTIFPCGHRSLSVLLRPLSFARSSMSKYHNVNISAQFLWIVLNSNQIWCRKCILALAFSHIILPFFCVCVCGFATATHTKKNTKENLHNLFAGANKWYYHHHHHPFHISYIPANRKSKNSIPCTIYFLVFVAASKYAIHCS